MNTLSWAALAGIIMPMVVTAVKRMKLAPVWNALIAIGVCAAAGTLIAWLNGSFNGVEVATAIVAVYAVAAGLYSTFWNIEPFKSAETALNAKTK